LPSGLTHPRRWRFSPNLFIQVVSNYLTHTGITMFDQGRTIEFYPYAGIETNKMEFNLVHEYGHFINQYVKGFGEKLLEFQFTDRLRTGMPNADAISNQVFQQNTLSTVKEEWADMFLYWVYNGFDINSMEGVERKQAINKWMKHIASINSGQTIGIDAMISNLESLGYSVYGNATAQTADINQDGVNDNLLLRYLPKPVPALFPVADREQVTVIGITEDNFALVITSRNGNLIGLVDANSLFIDNTRITNYEDIYVFSEEELSTLLQ